MITGGTGRTVEAKPNAVLKAKGRLQVTGWIVASTTAISGIHRKSSVRKRGMIDKAEQSVFLYVIAILIPQCGHEILRCLQSAILTCQLSSTWHLKTQTSHTHSSRLHTRHDWAFHNRHSSPHAGNETPPHTYVHSATGGSHGCIITQSHSN